MLDGSPWFGEKTAVCSGCGTRHRTFSDRTTRRVRDTDAAGWHIYLVFEQRRVACVCGQGVKVERLAWLVQNPLYRGTQDDLRGYDDTATVNPQEVDVSADRVFSSMSGSPKRFLRLLSR